MTRHAQASSSSNINNNGGRGCGGGVKRDSKATAAVRGPVGGGGGGGSESRPKAAKRKALSKVVRTPRPSDSTESTSGSCSLRTERDDCGERVSKSKK